MAAFCIPDPHKNINFVLEHPVWVKHTCQLTRCLRVTRLVLKSHRILKSHPCSPVKLLSFRVFFNYFPVIMFCIPQKNIRNNHRRHIFCFLSSFPVLVYTGQKSAYLQNWMCTGIKGSTETSHWQFVFIDLPIKLVMPP